jgi:hypothetical protein
MDGWVRDCGGNVGKMLAEKRTMFDGYGWRFHLLLSFFQ